MMTDTYDAPDKRSEDSLLCEGPVEERVPPTSETGDIDDPEVGGEGWSGADIEQAYLKALHAMEEAGCVEPSDSGEQPLDGSSEADSAQRTGSAAGLPAALDENIPSAATMPQIPNTAAALAVAVTSSPPASANAKPPSQPMSAASSGRSPAGSEVLDEKRRATPAQVIEAALFVGGGSLTARRLGTILGGTVESSFVEQVIDGLNDQYVSQARPYEIRLGDGGYRLELRPEYERLRHRVQGTGPREVRLSQEALEVLALVAYKQPISREDIEGFSRKSAGNLLRQLLQRELIMIRRGEAGPGDVKYLTGDRFLSLFGLGNLDDLPQAEDVGVK